MATKVPALNLKASLLTQSESQTTVQTEITAATEHL